jgi:hypothetical protein
MGKLSPTASGVKRKYWDAEAMAHNKLMVYKNKGNPFDPLITLRNLKTLWWTESLLFGLGKDTIFPIPKTNKQTD